jgi:small redox-active disulfide protein 2
MLACFAKYTGRRANAAKGRLIKIEREYAMKLVQVLGTGCAKCTKLKENAETAVKEMGVEATVEKIEDINQITSFGVMMTPALAIDGEVKLVGKVASPDEIKQLLT